MALVDGDSLRSCSRTSSIRITQKTDWGTLIPPPSLQRPQSAHSRETFDDVELSSCLDGLHIEGIEAWNSLDNIAALGLTLNDPGNAEEAPVPFPRMLVDDWDLRDRAEEPLHRDRGPFRKWMRTLHRRAEHRRRGLSADTDFPWELRDSSDGAQQFQRRHRRKSSSGSSFGFVAAVKSASLSLTSVSVTARSRRNTGLSRGFSRSSRTSMNGGRLSEDSCYPERSTVIDPAAMERSLQRRRILEELINTEEGYIGDIRALMNVYVTILASLPTLPIGLRSSINRNLTEIVELHEELLGDLHRTVPHSEYTQIDIPIPLAQSSSQGHRRMRSLDAVPENRDGMSWLSNVRGMTADPQDAAEVAKVFGKKMNRFFIYEEYGAKYEMMIKDVASANRTMPQWVTYQKGLEALASSLGSVNSHLDQSKKSLTIGDLLVKPIQRICKYPLLFAELLKQTPVSDCPYSHMEVENTLIRLREATAEINRATNDARMKATLEKTWILQDRLVFPNQRLDAASRNRIRSFGHIHLCGALHVCWQTKDGVNGQYMICLLYDDVVCLASAGKADQIYTVQACLALGSIKTEEVDNGRGLQCHTAPFSWKLVFECDHQLYEIIMTACTPKEELEWRSRLNCPGREGNEHKDANIYSSLSLNIKSLGTVFGKPGTIARRISIHRATTVGPKSPLCQVILKNTSILKDVPTPSSALPINRSQSLLTTNTRIPVLAPSRGERARLEALLSDVWSREILPFPGMTNRSRSEHIVRASASSMMRKLSVASIASSFTKRSASLASTNKATADDDKTEIAESARLVAKFTREEGWATGSPLLRGQEDGRLPIIRDDAERKTSSNTSTNSSAFKKVDVTGTVTGAIRRLEALKRGSESPDGEGCGVEKTALRTSSANSLRLSRHTSSSMMSPCSSEKENFCQLSGAKPPSLSKLPLRKSSNRWVKVGALNRDVMVQGFRSFFR